MMPFLNLYALSGMQHPAMMPGGSYHPVTGMPMQPTGGMEPHYGGMWGAQPPMWGAQPMPVRGGPAMPYGNLGALGGGGAFAAPAMNQMRFPMRAQY